MAIKCVSAERNYVDKTPTKKFIIDTEADVALLPKCGTGSIAIVASGGKVFMINASNEWVEAGYASYTLAEGVSF